MMVSAKFYPMFVILLFASCADGQFSGNQRAQKKHECKPGDEACRKGLELGEPTGSLPETTVDTKGSDPNGTLTNGAGKPKAKVNVAIGPSNSTTETPSADGVCSIPPTNVGVSAKLMGPNWRCKIESMTIPDAIVLPADATDINVKITQYGVDDWNPCTKLNGKEIGCSRDEKKECTVGGPGPRYTKFDSDLSQYLKPGANELYVESFNKHTYWSMWFTVTGTYKSLQEGCKHSLKLIKD